jgi:hypothetical protein
MTRQLLDIYPVRPGHSGPIETTEEEDLPARYAGQRPRQPTHPRTLRARRRLEAIGLSVAALALGLLAMAHGPTSTRSPDAPVAPASPQTVTDARSPAVAAYQADWTTQRAGERATNASCQHRKDSATDRPGSSIREHDAPGLSRANLTRSATRGTLGTLGRGNRDQRAPSAQAGLCRQNETK